MNALGGLRVLALVLLAALSLFILFSPSAHSLRHAVFDRYQRLFVLERLTQPVTIVAIDEGSLERYGQWPWPRTRMAEIITRINELGAASIGLDMVFPEADRVSPGAIAMGVPGLPPEAVRALLAMPSNDDRFAAAMRGRYVVLGIGTEDRARGQQPPRGPPVDISPRRLEMLEDLPAYIGSIDVIDRAAFGRGLMNAGAQDQAVRVVPLVARIQGAVVPSLALESLRAAVGGDLRVSDGRQGLATLSFGDVATPMRDDGSTWLRMGPHDPTRFVPVTELLEGNPNPERFKNKVVLMGIFGLGTFDYKTTPLGEFVPGVEVHAQVIENLYNGVKLTRPPMALRAEALALLALGFALIAFVPRMSALQSIHLVAGMVIVLFGTGVIAFLHFDLLLDPAWPAIGTLAVFATVVVGTLSEAERQRRQLRDQAARMAGEVDAARRIQMGLLPNPRETLANDRRFALAAALEPARTVGGDFYDCFMIDPGRLFFVIADVSGKGLPAALFMASVKSHIKSAALRIPGHVGGMLSHAQGEVERENPEQLFVTVFAGVLDVATGKLQYANAGHEPPYLRTADGAPERVMDSGGPPICVVPGFEYPSFERQLAPGEWLCAVTDGVTEAMNPAREFFGGERLRTTLSWMPEDVTPEDLLAQVRADLARFAAGAEAADDVTLLALRWWGGSGPPAN